MPKEKQNDSARLRSYVKKYEPDFTTDGKVLFCTVCEKPVSAEKKFTVEQHIKTTMHINTKRGNKKQELISNTLQNRPSKSDFNAELCNALVAANIPLWKLENKTFSTFLSKHMGKTMPAESTLRKNYVQPIYEETMRNIRQKLNGKNIWISIDETTDAAGRYVANAIVGTLESDATESSIFLLNVDFLEKTNSTTVARFFDDSLKLIAENFNRDNVLLFVTDAAPYMVKAGKGLKLLYPKMVHVICVTHALHRVSEFIRERHVLVNDWVGNLKQIFLKAPKRVQIFKDVAGNLPLPPKPVITRWGTWVSAVLYSSKNYEILKEVLNRIDESSIAINKCKEVIRSNSFKTDLAYIATNFGFLPDSIDCLQKQNMLLVDTFDLLQNVENQLIKVNENKGKEVLNKFQTVLGNNPDLDVLKAIAKIHNGESVEVNYTPEEIAAFKYAPIVSCDVERSFSTYKNLLSDKRYAFSKISIRQMLVIQFNQKEE